MSEHPQGQKHCSFCGKTQSEVGKLIAGEDAYICNECVDVCLDLVQKSQQVSTCGLVGAKSKHTHTHSLQMYASSPEISFTTSDCVLPPNEQCFCP